MLHLPDGTTRIAPAYDVAPQAHRDSGRKMALAINRTYLRAAITIDDLVVEGEAWNVRAPRAVITSAHEATDLIVHMAHPVENG
ncbi:MULTISPECIES: hypothetical protein [unclassified Cryobacterium]|uniref:hypothetical protein n=1 Tax=unclassified Cryobacterium TaxID=2649013 RepID=UPI000CE5731A|nr:MULTISPECIES: hypothetical protein [unclassified Cryobacterium]